MFGRILAFVMCPALLATGACTRTDDGTVVIPRQLDVRRVWDKPPRQAPAIAPAAADVFPSPPHAQPPPPPRPRRHARPARATPPMAEPSADSSSAPDKPLACRNVGETGRRFRVVCD